MSEATLNYVSPRRSLLSRVFLFWKRDSRRREEPDSEPTPIAVSEARLGEIVRAALGQHAAGIREDFESNLETQLTGLLESFTLRVQEFCDESRASSKRLTGAVDGLRTEVERLRFTVESKLSSVDRDARELQSSVNTLEEATARLGEQCLKQVTSSERQVEVTKDTLATLRTSTDQRLRQLGDHHRYEIASLNRQQEERQAESERARQSLAVRLRKSSDQLERIATRSCVPGVERDFQNTSQGKGDGVLHRVGTFFSRPLKFFRGRLLTTRRLAELERQLERQRDDLRDLKDALQLLAVEAVEPGGGRARAPRVSLEHEEGGPLVAAAATANRLEHRLRGVDCAVASKS